jgi:ribonuclease HI
MEGNMMMMIWKVKSHTGIAGNEEADKAAVAVARGEVSAE